MIFFERVGEHFGLRFRGCWPSSSSHLPNLYFGFDPPCNDHDWSFIMVQGRVRLGLIIILS